GRRDVTGAATRLLFLERADIVDERPALLLRQVLPRRHRATTVADLPEDLAVRLRRDLRRRPVGGLGRRQRGRGGTVALAVRAVARHAILLGELLGVGEKLRVALLGRQRVLHVLRVGGCLPFPLGPDAGRDSGGKRGGGNGDGQRLAERPHGISSREETIVNCVTISCAAEGYQHVLHSSELQTRLSGFLAATRFDLVEPLPVLVR